MFTEKKPWFNKDKQWLRPTQPVKPETKTPEIDPRVEVFLKEHLSVFSGLTRKARHHVIAEAKKLRDKYPAHTAEYKRMAEIIGTFESLSK